MNNEALAIDFIGVSAVIGALGTVILGIILPIINSRISEREKKFERMLDKQDRDIELRFQQKEIESKEYQRRLNNTYSHLYGYLWELLYKCDADRICIVQPHPSEDRQFVSVSLEAVHPARGAAPQKSDFQFRKMSEWGGVIAKWTNNEFLIYRNIDDIKNIKLYSEAYRRGSKSILFYRLIDANGYWIGTLILDFIHKQLPSDITTIKADVSNTCILIADILPEYRPD